jgi:hypothetical protein
MIARCLPGLGDPLAMAVDEFLGHYDGLVEIVRASHGEDVTELRLARQDRNLQRIERHYGNSRR